MSDEQLVEGLVPTAVSLVATLRDYGPDEVAGILDRLSKGHLYRLSIVLAAMVDPDARPADLLAWVTAGPVLSRQGFDPSRPLTMCTDCGELLQESSLARHVARMHDERARLLEAGVNPAAAAVLAPRAVA